ncbi:guanylate-binding protein 6-like isoform X2 [Montipora foliosa]|uniref:guanylate-binding protein 6-like isoform X2 n=1 Tax=Montipora foliosa TaxID=591990 RepID=UPI0035F1D113
MDGSHPLRRFQSEDEDEALAKALKNSQQDKPRRTVPCHGTEGPSYDSSSRLPSDRNLEFQMQTGEDAELSRALALSLETHNGQLKTTDVKLKAQPRQMARGENHPPSRRRLAIPLCLPDNCKWNPQTGKTIKTGNKRSSLYVIEEALEQLRKFKGPVCVVSVAGPYRKGKSYILSEAFDQPEVFPLGHEMVAETMGIWLWIVPQKYKDSKGQEFTVVLLDSEGIDSAASEGFHDHQIFTLTVLLASVLIYNSQDVPSRSDKEGLEYITKLSQRIQIRSNTGGHGRQEDMEFFHKTFPHFIWLLRDVTKDIPSDCKDVKDFFLKKVFKEDSTAAGCNNEQVAESILRFFSGFDAFTLPSPTVDVETMKSINQRKDEINPKFLSGLEEFKSLIKTTLSPKHSFNDGEFVTGEGLAVLVQLYVHAINTPNVIPNVQSAWDTFVTVKCSDAKQAALVTYDSLLASQLTDELPCSNDMIRMRHSDAFDMCQKQFMAEMAGISTNTVERTVNELKESVLSKLKSWLTDNETKTRQYCKDLLGQLKRNHLDPVLQKLQGKEAARVSFDDVIIGYTRIKDDYYKSAKGAKDVIAAVFFEFHPELMKEKEQYLGLLKQLKDFDDERGRNLAAQAYLDQERKRLEEQQSRLQEESRERKKEMEMLLKNLEEERKRFSEQMESERKAQQGQMDNMIATSMKRAQEERQAFIRENQALKERFMALQEHNENNIRMIKKLSEMASKKEQEEKVLRQQLEVNAKDDSEALIKELNEKHDAEMKALRDDMNAKLDEVIKQASSRAPTAWTTEGLIGQRAKKADDLHDKIKLTRKEQEDVEKPGFWTQALQFVGRLVVPAVGAVLSAVEPIAGPLVEGVSCIAGTFCNVM